jgi:hypothetical protein
VKWLAGCHESSNRIAVHELHETIEIVAEVDLLEASAGRNRHSRRIAVYV